MNKVVFKTALTTICALIVLAVAVFIIWFFGFPQSMATLCEKTGNYSFAVQCAYRRYSYTGDAADLARCAEDAILSGEDDFIVKYGEMLISDPSFDAVCTQKDEKLSSGTFGEYTVSYKSYVCGNVAAARYRKGDCDKAVDVAVNSGEAQSFIKLVILISDKNDAQAAKDVLAAFETFTPTDGGYEDVENLKAILINIGE